MSGPLPPPYRVQLTFKPDGQFEWLKFNIDTPEDQSTLQGLVCEVAGWVAFFPDSGEPPPVSVVVGVGDFGWLEAPIELNRPDVVVAQKLETGRGVLTANCGFSFLLPAYLVHSGGPYTVSVRCRNETSDVLHEIGEISFRSIAKSHWKMKSSVNPLIVNSVGRSGSSLLCRMLAMHQKIHVPTGSDQFGEVSICEYVCRILSTLSSNGTYPALNRLGELPDFHHVEPPHFCSTMLKPAGTIEYQSSQFLRTLTENARVLATNLLSEYFSFAQSDRPWLRYVAEKSWNSYNLNVLHMLFENPKEVFIVRGPAEFLRSQRAFLEKQGMRPEHIDRQHVATANRLGNLARSYADRTAQCHVIKFEDLVADPKPVIQALMDYLELQTTDGYLDSIAAIIGDDSSHSRMLRTDKRSKAADEFEEYRSRLDASQQKNLATFCAQFGYELS